jgi:glycosyltransferase involved in cell wall biosynthesis
MKGIEPEIRLGRPRKQPAKVGAMTCALNEVSCVAFAIGVIIDLVDLYVFIDTGSTDGTEMLVRELYNQEIDCGKLIVEQLGPLPDYDISIARSKALELFREHDIDYCLKVDADDIFYDEGARQLLALTRRLPENVAFLYCHRYELYQWEILETVEWLQAIRDRRDVFWEMPFVPDFGVAMAVKGADARGKWTDEARTGKAEGFYYDRPIIRAGIRSILSAHYGWARPLRQKRDKIAIWYGNPHADPRGESLHLTNDWRRPKRLFYRHPEIFDRLIEPVLGFIRGQYQGGVDRAIKPV